MSRRKHSILVRFVIVNGYASFCPNLFCHTEPYGIMVTYCSYAGEVIYIYGRRLRELREKQGWDLQDLAKRLGVDRSTVGNWENERRQPSIEIFLRLAQEYHCSLDYIMNRTDDKTAFIEISPKWREAIRRCEIQGFTEEEIHAAITLIELAHKRAGREI